MGQIITIKSAGDHRADAFVDLLQIDNGRLSLSAGDEEPDNSGGINLDVQAVTELRNMLDYYLAHMCLPTKEQYEAQFKT